MAIWTWIAGGACGLALVILLKKRQKDRKIIKCRSNAQLIGQTAIVTGGSSGLGDYLSASQSSQAV